MKQTPNKAPKIPKFLTLSLGSEISEIAEVATEILPPVKPSIILDRTIKYKSF